MQRVDALIAGVSQKNDLGQDRQTAAFEKDKVVGFSCTGCYTYNLLFHRVDHDLSFLGMALFLARIAAALFFWGRSMRCSLASTTITVRFKEPSCNAFLPGR